MPESSWRKRFAIIKSRFYLYPAPESMKHTRWFWIATGLVTSLALAFAAFYIIYMARMQDAFRTPAEDVGIMDQAVWSITNGHLLQQTICNIVSDTNCYNVGGFSRFAIHFEPILFPLSLLYALWPGPKMLMVLQTLVVASGAFPAFWLARLRLRSELAGAAIAALYLLYPELQQAEAGYFHAVVLTSALLMFTLYFLYTRRTIWLFVFAILSMACKEEIPLVIAMLGLWSLVFQQRWRSGLGLVALAVVWVALSLLIFRVYSPTGHPLLSSRYAYLGSGIFEIVRTIVTQPVSLIKQHIFEHAHFYYIRLLFSPVNYLSLLAPWVLIIAVPSLLLNLFSSDPNMYQGTAQYNAEIVPVLVFATIEALVMVVWLVQWLFTKAQAEFAPAAAAKATAGQTALASSEPVQALPDRRTNSSSHWLQPAVLFVLVAITLLGVLRHDQTYGVMPYSQDFIWPQVTSHDAQAQRFINMIPATASVSAQSSLVPHLSKRTNIYMFPYADDQADYDFLDVTSDNYPYAPIDYRNVVRTLLLHGNYGIVASGDGYLLLKHGLPGPGLSPVSPATDGINALPNLPEDFCSFTQVAPQTGTNLLRVDFMPRVQGRTTGKVSLVGFQVNRPGAFLQVVTYWKVSQGFIPPLHLYTSVLNSADQEVFGTDNFAGSFWCPSSTWQPGTIVQMRTDLLYIGDVPKGLSHLALSLLPYSATSGTISSSNQGLALLIVQAPATVSAVQGRNLLQLQTFTL
ncbi:MAG TPA: DUF2079 domain-containing protein [Ktedonobacteraceae bacterium]